jgi:adenosylcobinamide amidohydrolase
LTVVPVAPHLLRPGGGQRGVLLWRFETARAALSSSAVGGGWGSIDWVIAIGVDLDYDRTDLDRHAAEVAAAVEAQVAGATLFTAVDVGDVCHGLCAGVRVDATVGVTQPTWAAADEGGAASNPRPGTVNVVAQLPVALEPAAAVNAVVTITEAKSQGLFEAGVDGTGTASDAVVVCWPPDGAPEPFAGPRSTWGARLARATHAAVAAGLRLPERP